MNNTDFTQDNVNSRFVADGEGEAFQRFVFEALRPEYPQLHLFPTGGKDGGIDLSQTGESRIVGETKKVGAEDVLSAANSAWNEVAKRLRKHLGNPDGPTKGQSQYRPWYRQDIPVTEYLFCISGRLANESQRDTLCDAITAVFIELATAHEHLSHLGAIKVRVLEWSYFESVLQQSPYLLFRWFPNTRPVGITPLEKQSPKGGFRDYLSEDRLPYLSRSAFLQQQEDLATSDMDDESALLKVLDEGQVTGLVVTGIGGVGKTRLAYEIGWKAHDAGWTVLVVGSALKSESIEALAERMQPDVRLLLIFDYIETQRNFIELANALTDLNSTYDLRLHFVANCRSSYYHVLEGAIEHRRVDLSPTLTSDLEDWNARYSQAVVRYILQQGVPDFDDRHVELCRDLPVFAVFLSYLIDNDRQPWLEEILVERDFGQWVASRIKRTLRDEGIDQDLAVLMCMFPMSRSALSALGGSFERIIECLATDGWVGPLPDDASTWAAAHDVLADRIVLSYLERAGRSADLFVERLLGLAQGQELLRSSLTALQRLAGQPVVMSVAWKEIFESRCVADAVQWEGLRDVLIRTSLLTETEKLDFLESCPEFWLGSELEMHFQNAIGWIARWALNDGHDSELTEEQQATLRTWIVRASTHADKSNFVLTSAVRWCPEEVRELAFNWMSTKPGQFQTHYLIVAWLNSNLPYEEIEVCVTQWLADHPNSAQVSFVMRSWLDAAGKDGTELAKEPIRVWLETHQTDVHAQFVYKSWLDAAGKDEAELVQKPILVWLKLHQTELVARFVYNSWLNAVGNDGLALVRGPIREWLKIRQNDIEASFVYKSWLNAAGKGGLELVREPIRVWLETHQADVNAQFVYSAWLDVADKDDLALVQEPIREWLKSHAAVADANFVYRSWLDAAGKDGTALVLEPIREWLESHQADPDAKFVYRSWLNAAGKDGLALVREPIREWLLVNQTDFEADFVFRAWLESEGEFSLVASAATAWLHRYRDKQEAVYVTKSLARQTALEVSTICDILFWARKFCNDEDAIFRTYQLGLHLFNSEVANDLIDTAEALLNVRKFPLRSPTTWLLDTVCSFLICARSLQEPVYRARVDAWLIDWIQHVSSFRDQSRRAAQRRQFVERLAELLYDRKMDTVRDRDSLRKFLHWVNKWTDEKKAAVQVQLEELAAAFPDPALWDIVVFGPNPSRE